MDNKQLVNEIGSVNGLEHQEILFPEKSCTKCGGETSSLRFFRESKLSILLDQQSEVSYSLLLYSSRGLPKHIETKVLNTCFHFI